jgi:hypothetical protein
MRFAKTTFVLTTKLGEGAQKVNTTVTLLDSDVPDQIVANALVSGQSPRVRWQTNERNSGKIRPEATLTWAQWIGSAALPSVAREMSSAEIVEKATRDPAILAEIMAEIQRRNAVTPFVAEPEVGSENTEE